MFIIYKGQACVLIIIVAFVMFWLKEDWNVQQPKCSKSCSQDEDTSLTNVNSIHCVDEQ